MKDEIIYHPNNWSYSSEHGCFKHWMIPELKLFGAIFDDDMTYGKLVYDGAEFYGEIPWESAPMIVNGYIVMTEAVFNMFALFIIRKEKERQDRKELMRRRSHLHRMKQKRENL